MRKPFALFALSVAALSPLGLCADEGHAHKLMGTVTAVHVEMMHVEMKTNDGKAAAFYVTDSTKYLKGKTPALLADLIRHSSSRRRPAAQASPAPRS